MPKSVTITGLTLDQLRRRFGPYAVAAPDNAKANVVLLLPLSIRYCDVCHQLKPKEEMREHNLCMTCGGRLAEPVQAKRARRQSGS